MVNRAAPARETSRDNSTTFGANRNVCSTFIYLPIFGGNYSDGDFANWAMGDMDYDGLFTATDAAIFGGFYDEALPQV